MDTEKIKAQFIEYLREKPWFFREEQSCGSDPCFYVETYVDYRDEISYGTICEILESDDPEDALDKKLEEWYGDQIYNERNTVRDKFIASRLEDEEFACVDNDTLEEVVDDLLVDMLFLDLPTKHFMQTDVYCNIFVDTGDGNYDYVLNHVYPAYGGSYKDFHLDDKASLVWLAKQQGCTKTQLKRALLDDEATKSSDHSAFLNSIRTEVANVSTHMNMLTFLVKMSLEQCIALNRLIKLKERNGHRYDAREYPYSGYIVLDKKTRTGLYDPWNGGGSIMEIEPDKDVRIPVRFIRSALPDGGDGYSIANVYGVCRSWWEAGGLKKIHAPAKSKTIKTEV